jgi:PPM family protein phosphatase
MTSSKSNPPKKDTDTAEIAVALGSLTHVGMVRSANQDAYGAILAPNTPPGIDALLAVADGMGGHQAGEVASAMAIQGLVRHLSPPDAQSVTPLPQEKQADSLGSILQQVNGEIFQAAKQPQTQGMGTTFTVALIAGLSLSVAHVGDSRMYLLRNGQLKQLSSDHSWVAEEVARGALSPEEAQAHPRRNILTRAMGTTPNVKVDTFEAKLELGDTLLLCSDGLHSLVNDQEIAQILSQKSPQEASQALVDRANSLGGVDNVTVIVARLDPPSQRKRRRAQEAKTVSIQTSRQPRNRAWRITARILLLPPLLLLLILKLLGRSARLLLRLLRRR